MSTTPSTFTTASATRQGTLISELNIVVPRAYKEFIDKFIKAKKATDADIFMISPSYDTLNNDVILFTLGGDDSYTNKISFYSPAIKTKQMGNSVKFPLVEFNEMLLNNKTSKPGVLKISEQGVLKIEFENEEGVKISYVLVGKE
jgi:hypothetical protein